MDQQNLSIKVFKLVTGETIIGMVDISKPVESLLTIIKPVLLDVNKFFSEEGYTETVSIRKWILVSDDESYTMSVLNVLSIASVGKNYIEKYIELAKNYHITPENNDDDDSIEDMGVSISTMKSKYLH